MAEMAELCRVDFWAGDFQTGDDVVLARPPGNKAVSDKHNVAGLGAIVALFDFQKCKKISLFLQIS